MSLSLFPSVSVSRSDASQGARPFYYTPGPGAAGLALLLALVVVCDISVSGFSVRGYATPAVFVAPVLLAVAYGRWRAMDARLVSLASALAMLFAVALFSSMIQYLATAQGAPRLVDHDLLAADRALGFDWFAFVGFFDRSKLFSEILLLIYQSIGVQMFAVLALFILRRDYRGIDAFIIGLIFLIGVASLVTALYPSIGVTGIVDVAFPNTGVAGGRTGQPTFLALRSGALREINLAQMFGLITFPSGHAAFAVLTTLAARRVPCAVWPFIVVNALMLISTLTHGGHYLVDVLAGVALAAASWPLAKALAARDWGVLRRVEAASA